MKKRLLGALMCMALSLSVLTGCAAATDGAAAESGSAEAGAEESAGVGEGAAESSAGTVADGDAVVGEAAVEPAAVTTVGDAKGTHMEFWSFVEAHNTFYAGMVEQWNEANPDRTIEVTFTTYPYGDMHTKLLTSLTAGTGAPDICDVEMGQVPAVYEGLDTWLYPLDEAIVPYEADIVPAQLEVYKGADGKQYGASFHVGATVMYWNLAARAP